MPVVNGGPWFDLLKKELEEIEADRRKLINLAGRKKMKREPLYVKNSRGRYSEASDEVIIGSAMTIMMERGLTSTVTKVVRDLFARAGTDVKEV